MTPPRPKNSPGRPTIWMDVTTSWRARHAASNGTLRIERSLAAALPAHLGATLRFCRYDRVRRRFVAIASLPAASLRAATTQAGATRGKQWGRTIERMLRRTLRGALAHARTRLDRYTGATAFPEAARGDILLLAGETWAQHDFDLLRALRADQGLRIAALCQDMIPVTHPQFFESVEFVERYRAYAAFLTRDVDLLLAISQATRKELVNFAAASGGSTSPIEIVPLGADFQPARSPRAPSHIPTLASRPFVLSVSSIQSRKNFDLLYRLWRRMSQERTPDLPMLVIVGQRGFGSDDLLWQIAHDPLVAQSITVLHGVGDDELAWLYQHCRFTLYPSHVEGWGLPISESFAYGKFCIASDTSSLPEAGQGLAMHLDPLDFGAWRAAVVNLNREPERLAALEQRIRREFKAITWDASAAQVAGRLQGVLSPN